MFSDWVPNSHFVATKNPNYWRPGLPYLDSIEYQPLIDPGAREDALRSGSIDIMQSNFTQNLVDLHGLPGFTVINDLFSTFEPDMDCVMLNLDAPPLNDIRVRQALAYAADPAVIVARHLERDTARGDWAVRCRARPITRPRDSRSSTSRRRPSS